MIRKSIRIGYKQFWFGSIKQFKLPDLGEKIKEATVKQWHVKVGDTVEEFQSVADVATDKMFTQIPSSYSGKIHKIFHEVEDMCQVGEVFLEIEVPDDHNVNVNEKPKQTETITLNSKQDQQQVKQEKEDQKNEILATPAIRRLAKEKGIDLSKVKGTGQQGRILACDIDNYGIVKTNEQAKSQKPCPAIPQKSPQPVADMNSKNSKEEFNEIKMTSFQRGMQKSMTEANKIPHFYLQDEYDLTALSVLREQLKKNSGVPITFMSLFIKAFSQALLKYPIMNSLYNDEKPFEFKRFNSHNISLAMDSPNGLVVPNIKNCQDLSILEIHKELGRLRELGEKGLLSQKELMGGTICISNVGTIGGTYCGPLILVPQVCIVGLGRLMTVPRYDDKMNVVPKKIMNVSFGCDHRVLDGATSTRFSNQWKSYLENPYQMLSSLK